MAIVEFIDFVIGLMSFLVTVGLLAVALLIGSLAGVIICFILWLKDRKEQKKREQEEMRIYKEVQEENKHEEVSGDK